MQKVPSRFPLRALDCSRKTIDRACKRWAVGYKHISPTGSPLVAQWAGHFVEENMSRPAEQHSHFVGITDSLPKGKGEGCWNGRWGRVGAHGN